MFILSCVTSGSIFSRRCRCCLDFVRSSSNEEVWVVERRDGRVEGSRSCRGHGRISRQFCDVGNTTRVDGSWSFSGTILLQFHTQLFSRPRIHPRRSMAESQKRKKIGPHIRGGRGYVVNDLHYKSCIFPKRFFALKTRAFSPTRVDEHESCFFRREDVDVVCPGVRQRHIKNSPSHIAGRGKRKNYPVI